MSCISSKLNSMMGQDLGLRSLYRVVRSSMNQVRLAGIRKIELNRSRVRYTSRLRNLAQVS